MIAERLSMLMADSGLQQSAIAALLGIEPAAWSQYVHRRRKFPAQKLPELAKILRTTTDELIPLLYRK